MAAWLAEALVQRRGFAGLAPGMRPAARAVRALLGRPVPGARARRPDGPGGALVWLNERLPGVLRELPLTAGPEERPYSFADHERAQRLETIRNREPKAAERAEAGGAVTLAAFEAELAATPDGGCARSWRPSRPASPRSWRSSACSTAISAGMPRAWARCARVLQHIVGLLATTLRDRPNRLVERHAAAVGVTAGGEGTVRARPSPTAAKLALADGRSPAARRPTAVSPRWPRSWSQNEPHSPVGPLLERALEWGAMPLDQLVQIDQPRPACGSGPVRSSRVARRGVRGKSPKVDHPR